MVVTVIHELLTEGYRGTIGIAQEGVLDDNSSSATSFEALNEVLSDKLDGFAVDPYFW